MRGTYMVEIDCRVGAWYLHAYVCQGCGWGLIALRVYSPIRAPTSVYKQVGLLVCVFSQSTLGELYGFCDT